MVKKKSKPHLRYSVLDSSEPLQGQGMESKTESDVDNQQNSNQISEMRRTRQSMKKLIFSPKAHSTQTRLESLDSAESESSAVDDIEKILQRQSNRSSQQTKSPRRSTSSPAEDHIRRQTVAPKSSRSRSVPRKSLRRATVGDKKKTPARKSSQPVPVERLRNEPVASGSTDPSMRTVGRSRKQAAPKKMPCPSCQKNNILNEILKYQCTTDNLIPRLSFGRVIREILMKYSYSNCNLRISTEALVALQESAEMYLVQIFEDSYLCTVHRGRVTLIVKDMQLAMQLRKCDI